MLLSGCSKPKINPNEEGIYEQNGVLFSYLYPLKEDSVKFLGQKIDKICDTYLTENNRVFYTLVPDKTYFSDTDEKTDHEEMAKLLKENTANGQYIDIGSCLSLEDYYKTDGHWRQEKLFPVARAIGEAMGFETDDSVFESVTALEDYKGMYSGMWQEDIEGESLIYLESPYTKTAEVENYQKPDFKKVYDTELLKSETPYDVFLSGVTPFMTITGNPDVEKDLVIFRDSFGSSLAPLLLENYRTITLVDFRFMMSDLLPEFLQFEDQDVLFIYSAAVANTSVMLKIN